MQSELLHRVRTQLLQRNVGRAIEEMRTYMAAYQYTELMPRLDDVAQEYDLMKGYWQEGFRDPKVEENYVRLLHATWRIYIDAERAESFRRSAFLASLRNRVCYYQSRRDWSVDVVRSELEAFVSETTVLELEPPHQVADRRAALYAEHQRRMDDLFDYIWVSPAWTDQMAEVFAQLLLTPTVDTKDQQLMVSAVMLSVIGLFDMAKFRLLVEVYRQATDEQVRQRALVGVVLAIDEEAAAVFPEQRQLTEMLMNDDRCREELVELQMQMIYCINAERDHHKIQQEIMPDLLKGNNIRITRHGIEEVEDDELEDILHPEESEQRMERVEASFNKMMDMQRQGSDIYFGGFSQMKRFTFFQQPSNWFVPFYFGHPGIADVMKKSGSSVFLQKLMAKGPFCNSDKYSFVLAFQQVVDHLPQNLRDMFNRGELAMDEIDAGSDHASPAFIRRLYLQDIYRFYRVFNRASHIDNPFDQQDEELQHVLFLRSALFRHDVLGRQLAGVAALLMKQHLDRQAVALLRNVPAAAYDGQYYLMLGNALLRSVRHEEEQQSGKGERNDEVLYCFRQAVALQPRHEQAQQALARDLFRRKDYAEAEAVYDVLMTLNEERRSYRLNKAICMINRGEADDALPLLYQLSFDD